MLKQEQLEQKIIDYIKENFQGGDLQIINARDFTEQRQQAVFVVGIEQITQMNFGLPDYSWSFNCILDVFIDNDRDGARFFDNSNMIKFLLNRLQIKEQLKNVFGDIPVVGYIPETITNTITDDSNRLQIKFSIITSEV